MIAFPELPYCPLGTIKFETGETDWGDHTYNFLPSHLRNKSYFHWYFRDHAGQLLLLMCELDKSQLHTWTGRRHGHTDVSIVTLYEISGTDVVRYRHEDGTPMITSRLVRIWEKRFTSREEARQRWKLAVAGTSFFLREIAVEAL